MAVTGPLAHLRHEKYKRLESQRKSGDKNKRRKPSGKGQKK